MFDGLSSAKAKGTDVTIIDTAGRLHTKSNLMEELGKIDRVITREYPEANRYNFIVIDAPNREGAPDWPDFMYSGKLFPTGLLNI